MMTPKFIGHDGASWSDVELLPRMGNASARDCH